MLPLATASDLPTTATKNVFGNLLESVSLSSRMVQKFMRGEMISETANRRMTLALGTAMVIICRWDMVGMMGTAGNKSGTKTASRSWCVRAVLLRVVSGSGTTMALPGSKVCP